MRVYCAFETSQPNPNRVHKGCYWRYKVAWRYDGGNPSPDCTTTWRGIRVVVRLRGLTLSLFQAILTGKHRSF